MPSGPASIDELRSALAPLLDAPERGGVLLDVDGTLAPIVRHADDAHVPEPTRTPLIEISKRYGLVACVSGRRAAVARRIVSIGSITYVGNHGAETLPGGSTTVEVDPDVAPFADEIRRFTRAAYDEGDLRRLRVREEDKGAIRAFHWRGVPDEEAAEAAVRTVAADAEAAGLATHWGRKVLEVRAPVQPHKGTAIRKLLETADLDAALYAGDDRTDLDAFRALRGAADDGVITHAVCVGVGSDETPDELMEESDVLVDGPGGVRRLLELLATA